LLPSARKREDPASPSSVQYANEPVKNSQEIQEYYTNQHQQKSPFQAHTQKRQQHSEGPDEDSKKAYGMQNNQQTQSNG